MKRVLIITYYWPPAGGSGVQRWVKFSKFLPSFGWQPVIYTPSNPQYTSIDRTLEAEIPFEAEVIRHPIREPYGIYRSLMGRGSSTDMKVLTSSESVEGKSRFKDKAALWLRSNLFIPDPRVWWVKPSVRFLRKYLEEHPVDVIVTTGPPQSMHMIGLGLHRATGIPWVSDFRDPWTKMYWFKKMELTTWSEKKHHALEQQVLDESDAVLSVTPFVQEDFSSRTRTPVHMITNGYDEEDFRQDVEPDGHFNLVHTGLFPADGNPHALWKVLGEKAKADISFRKELRIRLVGQTDKNIYASIEEAGLKDNMIDLGYKTHQTAVREQLAASVLLLPLRNDPEYRMILPGKVFEYLASRRPVLGIGQEDGAMALAIREVHGGETFSFDNEDGIRSFIDDAWNRHLSGTLGRCTGDIEKYSRRELTRQLADLLCSL